MELTIIFFIAILIMSIVIHEVAHGYAAEMLGDPTARLAGRLTLNPIPHIDPLGSIIIPILLAVSNAGFMFGWAKPVPYNPYNLRKGKWGPAIVAAAGPLANFTIAAVFGLIIRFSGLTVLELLASPFFNILIIIVGINLMLGIFNLLPVAPLDGSKVLMAFLPYRYMHIMDSMQQYGFIIVLGIVYFIPQVIVVPLSIFFTLITGESILLLIKLL